MQPAFRIHQPTGDALGGQTALTDAELQLNMVLAAGDMGTWVWDTVTNMVHCSPRHLLLWDLDPSTPEVPAERVFQRILPEDRARVWTSNAKDIPGGHVESQFRIVRSDGEIRWLASYGEAVQNERGEIVRVVGVNYDITDRKRAEAELAEARRRVESALIAGEVGTFEWDITGERVGGDSNFARMFGVTLDEHGTAPLADYVATMHPDDQERVRQRIALTVNTGVDYEIEYRVISGGRTRWLLVRAKPQKDANGRVVRATGVCLDVTRLKLTEQSLRSSERRFRAVFEQAAIGMSRVRFSDARWIDVNDAFCAMVGYSREELLATPWPEITHPEDVDLDLVPFRRMAAGELNSYSVEKRFVHKLGHYVWARLTLSLVRDAQDRPDYEIAIIEDVTDRKQAEEAQRTSEARYRAAAEELKAIMDATPAGICVAHDPQCHVITGNRVAHEILGVPLNKNISSTAPGQAASPYFRIYRNGGEVPGPEMPVQVAAFTGAIVQNAELEAVHRDGTRRVFLITAAPLRASNGAIRGAVGAFTDITERVAAEKALRQSTSLLQAISDSTGDVIFAKDHEGRLTFANPATLALIGKPLEQVLGHTDVELLEDKQAARTVMANDRRIMESGMAEDLEEAVPLPDGTHRVWFSRKMPYRDADGKVVGLLGVSRDITQRKAAAEELAAAHRAAQIAKEAAEQASRAKDQFLAVLSHELRTPLTPVMAGLSMLQQGVVDQQAAAETLEMIHRNVEMEARLIDDLLDVTRIVRGKIELARQPVPLSDVIRRAVEVCQADVEARQVHLGLDLDDPNVYCVQADPARLQQVFWNLLKNAIKFTPHGGCVGIRCRRDGQHVLAEVIDSGEGIEPHLLSHIFNPFEQGGARVTRQFGGLGLGLTITRGVVELHGGTIEAHSEGKGKGATFRVRLPLLPRCGESAVEQSQRAASHEPAPAPGRQLRILLVEDHGDTARVMRRLLTSRGYAVETAGDVETALQLAGEHSFDLLLSDLGLPDGSGIDLIEALRERQRAMPAIALSGFGQEEDLRRTREAGFASHLIKPVNPDLLLRTIGDLMRSSHD